MFVPLFFPLCHTQIQILFFVFELSFLQIVHYKRLFDLHICELSVPYGFIMKRIDTRTRLKRTTWFAYALQVFAIEEREQ